MEAGRERHSGSIWLANVGYGAIAGSVGLFPPGSCRATGFGQVARDPVLHDGLLMSWNAAKRAIGWGYSSVIWCPSRRRWLENAEASTENNKPYTMNN
jgi:hypothetical protein